MVARQIDNVEQDVCEGGGLVAMNSRQSEMKLATTIPNAWYRQWHVFTYIFDILVR